MENRPWQRHYDYNVPLTIRYPRVPANYFLDNVYPREIDEVLYQHPKVADAVAVGIADEYRGETVKAFVVPKEGETLTEEEIIDFCREKLAAYKAPKMVEFRDELPKSAVGKILRKVLRDEEAAKNK
jgi:long-chain acyl-CoA synthetase